MEIYLIVLMALQVSMYAIVMMMFVRKRIQYVKQGKVPSKYYKTFQTDVDNYPKELRAIERHFDNLFEMPILFLIFCTLVIALGKVDLFVTICATAYLILRIVHMAIHIGKNKLMPRMMVFGLSSIILLIMWFYLPVRLILLS